ncbi:diacylglycerol/lipid kinase family protein [Sphingomonas sp.]|uniref:diacylglycerol/lipid kinase family protein n=1 Tax=Sphingomonas sp. TaxID=28214 RepID=UPI003B00D385
MESVRADAGDWSEAEPAPARRIQLFVNPRAGTWRLRRVAALRRAFEAQGATVLVAPSHGGPLAIAETVDHVCAVGGDGTVRHVAAAVARASRPLSMSVYPLGTVNLLARECGYLHDPVAFARRVTATPPKRTHYAAAIGDVPVLTCASVGPDSRAVERVSPWLKRLIGRAAYIVAFCGLLARWPRSSLRVVADGRNVCCEAVYVAKGRFFAGRWSFAPAAAVDDPLLHVVALERASRLTMLRFAWALLRGRVPRDATCFTCSALTIEGAERFAVQADGDIVARLPVEIGVGLGTIAFC